MTSAWLFPGQGTQTVGMGKALADASPAARGGGAAAAAAASRRKAARGQIVHPANFTAPGQVVIAGQKAAVARAVALAEEKKLRATPLKASAPFHCALMEPPARRMRTAF